jgi:hypothetical protein
MWEYGLLAQFKSARIGNNVISFDDLLKERNIEVEGEGFHVWVARKEKRDYLILNNDIKNLPIKIRDTKIIKDNQYIYHFINRFGVVGFTPERCYGFHDLVDNFFDVHHSNPQHFTLLKIVALAAYISRINVRICSNPEFGKDSTFEVLNYLTNQIAVFDKPRTMAKLEYGVVNKVLMVNELVPKTAEEKNAISEFLLSIGSFKPIYQKKTRGSSAHNTKDCYDISSMSLVICYNNLADVSKDDEEHYFDRVFGSNVLERFLPLKFSGKLAVEQFNHKHAYTEDIDAHLLKIARSIEYYRQNWEKELKPYRAGLSKLNLSGRQKKSLEAISYFINLYSNSHQEFEKLMNEFLECFYSYQRMVRNNTMVTDYERPELEIRKNEELKVTHEQVIEELPEIGLIKRDDVMATLFSMMQGGKLIDIHEFISIYPKGYEMAVGMLLDNLKEKGDIFEPRAGFMQRLE